MRISDWSSDVCSSDLARAVPIVDVDAPGELAIEAAPGQLLGQPDVRIGRIAENVEVVAPAGLLLAERVQGCPQPGDDALGTLVVDRHDEGGRGLLVLRRRRWRLARAVAADRERTSQNASQ